MKALLVIIYFIFSLFGFNPQPTNNDDLGPAIWVNPDTGMYETSDGLTWPAD